MLAFVLAAALAQAPSGAAIFENACAACHAAPADARVPAAAALRQRTPESIVDALTVGVMRQQGADLTDDARRAVAEFLTGRAPSRADATANACAAPRPFSVSTGAQWN